MAENRHSSLYAIRAFLPYLRPYRLWVGIKLFSTATNAANDIFLVYVLNGLVNASLAGDRSELARSIVYMLLSVAAGVVVSFWETYSAGRFSAYAASDMKNAFGARIDRLPVPYIEARHTGELGSRITNGIAAIELFLKGDLGAILFNVLRLVVSMIVMLIVSWPLTLITMLLIPLMAVLTSSVARPMNGFSSRLQQSVARTNSAVLDMINGIHIVKSYNLTQVLFRKFAALNGRALADSLLIEKRKAAVGSVGVFVQTAPFLLLFIVGGYWVIDGQLTSGGLVAFAMLLNYVVQALGVLPALFANSQVTAGIANNLFDILEAGTERTDGGRPSLSPSVPALEFCGVTFAYDGHRRVLDHVQFTLPQRKMVALVGASGSGKTTVFKLISGFYAAQEGCIKLFGEPLASWELSCARSMISLVSQDTFLFPGTIADNITCGNPERTMEEVIQAAKLAHIHEFVQSLPDGYDTVIGERGAKLSGGQKQRISIARAVLKNAPILLLDEATSALDTESEMRVQEAIDRLRNDKTVLVVAHRLSTIVRADEVLVMNNGRIVESGTHEQLLAMDGPYRRLYKEQLGKQADSAPLFEGEGA